MKKKIYDISELSWNLTGFNPWEWELNNSMEIGIELKGEIPPIPTSVPGSVQKTLQNNGYLPDWNLGLNARNCEWVENRHWVYKVNLPDSIFQSGKTFRLNCDGLDYSGFIFLNRNRIHEFANTHKPHIIDISKNFKKSDNELIIVFTCPPRWLGQFGKTSEMLEWKTRFNYYWDWTSRLVQIGIWSKISIEAYDEEIETLNFYTDVDDGGLGEIVIKGKVDATPGAKIELCIKKDKNIIAQDVFPAHDIFRYGITIKNLDIELWYPNNLGEQPLYDITFTLKDKDNQETDFIQRKIGFKKIIWKQNPESREDADPWLCHANGNAFFIQGINWTPILPNFADVKEEQYRNLLNLYKTMGINVLRVWGGGFLEKECFYNICDELGFLVWQEFPLSSSGVDNYPPDDSVSIQELIEIARIYITKRQHHACHFIWCGGNELMNAKEGEHCWDPVTLDHPLMKRFKELTSSLDPVKRFITSTPSGPSFGAEEKDYGKGIHWAVNGPWKVVGKLEDSWNSYWSNDDSLLRSETGAAGPSSVEIIRKYSGGITPFPCSDRNTLWKRHSWWIEWEQFCAEHGREANNLDEYVNWGQKRQKDALMHAAKCSKKRFPKCGGFIIWMGHDSYPCTANTSIIDFEGKLKPAGEAVKDIFNKSQEEL